MQDRGASHPAGGGSSLLPPRTRGGKGKGLKKGGLSLVSGRRRKVHKKKKKKRKRIKKLNANGKEGKAGIFVPEKTNAPEKGGEDNGHSKGQRKEKNGLTD